MSRTDVMPFSAGVVRASRCRRVVAALATLALGSMPGVATAHPHILIDAHTEPGAARDIEQSSRAADTDSGEQCDQDVDRVVLEKT